MKRLLVGIFFLGFVLLFNTAHVDAAQNWPKPGVNCGIGYPTAEQLAQNPNLDADAKPTGLAEGEVNEIHACCGGKWDSRNFGKFVEFPEGIKNIPFIGEPIKALERALDIANFPNNFLPFDVFPSAKTIVEAFDSPENVCLSGEPVGNPNTDSCYCKEGINPSLRKIVHFCNNIQNPNEVKECQQCLGYNPDTNEFSADGGGVWTGVGCVKTTLTSFIQETVFRIGIGFAGIVSLACIIYSAILLQVSQGNPEKIQSARDMIQSCIIGLLLLIFSVFILRLIGVDILRLPGFS